MYVYTQTRITAVGSVDRIGMTGWNPVIKVEAPPTCLGVSPLVGQRANGAEQLGSGGVTIEGELGPRVAAVLDNAHPGPVRPHLKGAGRRREEAAHVFEVCPADAPGAVHQEHHVGHGAGGAFWVKNKSERKQIIRRSTKGQFNTKNN